MNLQSSSDPHYSFVELHRTFHELSEHDSEADEPELVRVFGGQRLQWAYLTREYRLIILSEAGSGKTFEIRHIAQALRDQGLPAFFLRLEYIVNDFEIAFEVGTFDAFGTWLASSEEGWLFLDSVDEARLQNPRDFEHAIRRLSLRIRNAYDRTHIVITSRTTAWRPRTDLDFCKEHLPYASSGKSETDLQEQGDGADAILWTNTEGKGEEQSGFKIVAFDDLNSEQIAVFIRARGVKDSSSFLDAVERADAWSFTSRPQDLEELAEFWLTEGRIGTRLEIIQNSIIRRLAERDQDRAESHPLSATDARQGVKLLAAATTLAKDPTLKIPDGARNSKGIEIQSVLPAWNDTQQAALLSRPIFDEALYGTVRFHHRSVREYLTAEWFADLLQRATSRRTIERLFFRNQYELDIVVPSLRPILPWLSIWDDKIRKHVCEIAPEIFFEGGDPTQLPVDIRRSILHEVCSQMAKGTTGRSMHDYAAVQRFANSDLTEDIRALIRQYWSNEELVAFLLRMVWIGQLADALPEAMEVALTSTAGQYVRVVAFRAVAAIASEEEQERVRQSFLTEFPELQREWLAELIKGTQPTEQTLTWLLECLQKSEPQERDTVDYLSQAVTEFVGIASIALLPRLVTGLSRLLRLPPLIERRYCEVSKRFHGLLTPASKAIERLILARHPAAMQQDVLAVLHNILPVREYGITGSSEVLPDFFQLVPAWQELNRALFWFDVQKRREGLDEKRGERLTNFQQASVFGSFWRFDGNDFAYVTQEITRHPLLDDRLVALSLALHLYEDADRPRSWRERLKQLTAEDSVLSERLRNYLRPPAQDSQLRLLKQKEAKRKRRCEAKRKQQEQYHTDWKTFFKEKLDEAQRTVRENPGVITNPLFYLFKQVREKDNSSVRWTEYNWKRLIPAFGEETARFYRDNMVSFWQHYTPILRSEGAPPQSTPYAVIFGLIGLEIEAHETKGWPRGLDSQEVALVCRYAVHELNGFPAWFPKFFEAYPAQVGDFLLQEVKYELSIESPETETHYIISDLSWSGQWAWDRIAPNIYELLQKEPKNLSTLEKLLKIIQGSSLPDNVIEKLASRKCRALKNKEHLALWFAAWVGVAPSDAIIAFKMQITKIADAEQQTYFAMFFVTHLPGSHMSRGATTAWSACNTPEYLKQLYLLMHDYIRSKEDIDRVGKGVFSPGLRDDAQEARDRLLTLLCQLPGKGSFSALMDIAHTHSQETYCPWILLRAKIKAEQDGDMEPWSPLQVREFHDSLERTPKNHKELAELAVLRLLDLKDDLEQGDSSIAALMQQVTQETDMRTYIGRELREKAFGCYSIPQEEELADAKRPDLRFHGMGFDGPVPIELKLADKWTGPELFERLKNQLCGDYLRDNRSSRGIFLLVYRGEKTSWYVPKGDNRVDFAGLIKALQAHWDQIASDFSYVDDITVIGIDLTFRSNHKIKKQILN